MTTQLLVWGLALALVAAPGCAGERGHGEAEHAHDEAGGHDDDHGDEGEHANEVHVTAAQRARYGITTAPVGPGELDLGVDLPAEVRPDGDRLAHIVPRFPGIVKDVRKNVGDRVRSGDVLATIESSESLAPYPLVTLTDGIVIEKHLTRGEAIDREKQAYVIADLSQVWVDASVFQRDLADVRVGQAVRVSTGAGGPTALGRVSYLTPVVDVPTRTATARIVLPNPDGAWRPGIFATVRALQPMPVPLAIPRDAVQTIDGQTVAFVDDEHGFTIRHVVLGRAGDTLVEVLDGLVPGDEIAVTSTFLLKAEAGKGAAEHTH
jgi:membrane fusion protein, heavy metal efflux system